MTTGSQELGLDELATVCVLTSADEDFETLVGACGAMINAHIRRIGFRNALIGPDDLRQIALLAIRESLAAWSFERSSFSCFAGRVIRCRFLSAIARPSKRPAAQSIDAAGQEPHDFTDRQPGPDQIVAMRDEAESILSGLNDQDRGIIEQIAQGSPYATIGRGLGLTAKQVHNRVQRIRRGARAFRAAGGE